MMRNARAFMRGIEAALNRRLSMKAYLLQDVGRTPEQFALFLQHLQEETKALDLD